MDATDCNQLQPTATDCNGLSKGDGPVDFCIPCMGPRETWEYPRKPQITPGNPRGNVASTFWGFSGFSRVITRTKERGRRLLPWPSRQMGEYGPQAGNPAGVNKDSGFIDVRGGRALFLLVEKDVPTLKDGKTLGFWSLLYKVEAAGRRQNCRMDVTPTSCCKWSVPLFGNNGRHPLVKRGSKFEIVHYW